MPSSLSPNPVETLTWQRGRIVKFDIARRWRWLRSKIAPWVGYCRSAFQSVREARKSSALDQVTAAAMFHNCTVKLSTDASEHVRRAGIGCAVVALIIVDANSVAVLPPSSDDDCVAGNGC